ncbi:MAG: hypothetical protein R3F20_14055 [Planctomycetota bacterium]
MKREVRLVIDGDAGTRAARGLDTLSDLLARERAAAPASDPCREGACGDCVVLADGVLVAACITPVLQLDGARISTFAGLCRDDADEAPRLVAAARALARFADDRGLFPCDVCRSGVLLAAALDASGASGEGTSALSSRVCRCSDLAELPPEIERLRRELGEAP